MTGPRTGRHAEPLVLPLCRRKVCGHSATAHEHFRDGDDCGVCGRNYCPGYVGPTVWTRAWKWLRG